MKTAKDYLEAANAIVPKISVAEGIAKHATGNSVFVDVRDSGLIAQTGTIAGAERITRGMMEFSADPNTQISNRVKDTTGHLYRIADSRSLAGD